MTWVRKLLQSDAGFRLYQQESTILNVTEMLCELMQQQGVSRAELAQRANKSKAHISQLLDGEANMTLRTLSDLLLATGHSLAVSAIPLSQPAAAQNGVEDTEIDRAGKRTRGKPPLRTRRETPAKKSPSGAAARAPRAQKKRREPRVTQ